MGILDEMRGTAGEGRSWTWHFSQGSRRRAGGASSTFRCLRSTISRAGWSISSPSNGTSTQEVIFQERIRQWQKMEALGTLAGGIAHDLNNLLLPILINTELTLDEGKADAPDRPPAGPGPRSGPARPGHGQADHRLFPAKEQERRPVEILPVIRESLEFLRVSLPKNIRISEKIEAEVRPGLCRSDPDPPDPREPRQQRGPRHAGEGRGPRGRAGRDAARRGRPPPSSSTSRRVNTSA